MVSCDIVFPGFALVVYAEPADARRAFGKLGFKKFGAKNQPMLLEFA